MSRPLRIEFQGACYHVMNRTVAGSALFVQDRDREHFLECLENAAERFSIHIHAYCLMPNHYHVLLKTPLGNLSKVMHWLNVSYSVYFNRKHERHGHLFQGRFASVLVDAESYFKELSRYIHLNPVRASMVDHPDAYPWSSYRACIGKAAPPPWLDTAWLLACFGSRERSAGLYRAFVEGVDPLALKNPMKNTTAGCILGSSAYTDRIQRSLLPEGEGELDREFHGSREIRPLKAVTMERLIHEVCNEFQCSKEVMQQKGKKRNQARDMAIYLARELTDETGKVIGDIFGGICSAGVTMRYNHMKESVKTSDELARRAERISRGVRS